MAWYSYTLAMAVDLQQATSITTANQISSLYNEASLFVHTASRNGVLLARLAQIINLCKPESDCYLLKDFAKLEGEQLEWANQEITQLLTLIQQAPERVSEATKSPYTPFLALKTEGFEPLAAELVYPADALIEDGFFYEYPPEKVKQALEKTQAASNPDLPHDPDGESLEYVFSFLKSHLWLLQSLDSAKQALFYGELNT
jgi:hypothetical protein